MAGNDSALIHDDLELTLYEFANERGYDGRVWRMVGSELGARKLVFLKHVSTDNIDEVVWSYWGLVLNCIVSGS